MSASGKSSNRHYEYNRGYHGGGGHGIYAEAGRRDREIRDLNRRTEETTTYTSSRAVEKPKKRWWRR